MLSDKINFLDAFNPKALASMIAGNARDRRLAAGLTQQELAKKSGDIFKVAEQTGLPLKTAARIFDEVREGCKEIRLKGW